MNTNAGRTLTQRRPWGPCPMNLAQLKLASLPRPRCAALPANVLFAAWAALCWLPDLSAAFDAFGLTYGFIDAGRRPAIFIIK